MREMKDSGIAWIGAIPKEWHLSKIGSLYTQRNEKVSDKDYPPLSVTMQGILPQLATAAKSDDGDNRKLVRAGDFAINSRSDRRGSCGISPLDGSVSLINIILTPRTPMHPGYYNWLFHTTLFADEFYKWGHGIVADLWTTRWQEMKSISVPVPKYVEQERIAAFLDAECAEIDAVLEKTRSSIEEYKKLKQAVITQAVTKGIRGGRPMKDSGIEWIGEIPAEWDVIRNVFLYKEKSRLPEEDAVSLSLSQVDGLIATDDMKERSLKTSTYDGWKQVRTNDLVLNRFKGHLGVLFAASIEGMVSFHYGVYEPLRQFDSKFFEYLYHSDVYKAILGLKSNGMTIGLQNLSNQNFYSVYSLYPPEAEQQEITQYLDDKCSGIDALVVQKQEHLTEIENYKKSLIYEYVTGKKEVV